MRLSFIFMSFIALPFFVACQDDQTSKNEAENIDMETMELDNVNNENMAAVIGVSISGSENNYTFSVTIESPDTGCDQYADWWEVFNENGDLIYRRILAHSHVDEQPFTRSGSPLNITKNTFVYIRAHMNNLGYGTIVFSGTVEDGFSEEKIELDFHQGLETVEPLPDDCDF